MAGTRKLPDLRCLQAFDAFSRTGSVHAAAAELDVSAATISRRLSTLQAWSKTPLLVTDGRLLRMTPLGTAFARRLTLYNRQLEDALYDLTGESPESETVTVLISGALSLTWLTPRLIELALQFPHIEVRLVSGINDPYWFNRDFDIALTRTDKAPSTIAADFAAMDQVTLLVSANRIKDLAYAHRDGPSADWFRLQPVARSQYNRFAIEDWLTDNHLLNAELHYKEMPTLIACLGELSAAQASLIISRLFVQDAIQERVVCEPWPHLRVTGRGWYVCRRMDRPQREAVLTVADFLKAQIRTSLRRPPVAWPNLPFRSE